MKRPSKAAAARALNRAMEKPGRIRWSESDTTPDSWHSQTDPFPRVWLVTVNRGSDGYIAHVYLHNPSSGCANITHFAEAADARRWASRMARAISRGLR